jgi:nicotinamidase-related amidase
MRIALIPLALALVSAGFADEPHTLSLSLRTRVQPFKGDPSWQEVTVERKISAVKTAIIVCDMWDNHWCPTAAKRCGELAQRMGPVLAEARAAGVTVIHAPSDCMGFYKDSPARQRMLAVPKVPLPTPLALPDPPCPVDASDGGCDSSEPVKEHRAWTRQHPAIPIDEAKDFISDNGAEVYSLLKQRGIENLFVMGVHTNMCVLHRTFAIKPMTRLGIRCVLVRDLTDAMYNPKMKPFVSHEEGTARIIEYIEQYWCPTTTAGEFVRGCR